MERIRKRLLVGYFLTLVGLLLAIVVVSAIPAPTPPLCTTAVCNAATYTSLVGLMVILGGMITMAFALFPGGGGGTVPPATSANPQYSFQPQGPPRGDAATRTPIPSSAGVPRGAIHCPGCGTPITSDYGFCPRCGRNLPK